MPEKAMVSILIQHKNGEKVLEACLRSLKENTSYKPLEVILLDNGSTDKSIEGVLEKFPWVKVIKNKKFVSLADGVNVGFGKAKGAYLMWLNNDTLMEKGWLEELVTALESKKEVAAVSPVILPMDAEPKKEARTYVEKISLIGACILINRRAWERVGGFDGENFKPAYGEENDWCYRARNACFKLLEVRSSQVWHLGSYTAEKIVKQRYLLENTHRLKAMLYNLKLPDLIRFVPGLTLIFLNSLRQGSTFFLLQSYWENLKNIKTIFAERKHRLG